MGNFTEHCWTNNLRMDILKEDFTYNIAALIYIYILSFRPDTTNTNIRHISVLTKDEFVVYDSTCM